MNTFTRNSNIHRRLSTTFIMVMVSSLAFGFAPISKCDSVEVSKSEISEMDCEYTCRKREMRHSNTSQVSENFEESQNVSSKCHGSETNSLDESKPEDMSQCTMGDQGSTPAVATNAVGKTLSFSRYHLGIGYLTKNLSVLSSISSPTKFLGSLEPLYIQNHSIQI